MKRKLTTLIAALMAVSTLLSSCSNAENSGKTNGTETNTTTTAETTAETEEPKILPNLPEINFEGADFRVYNWDFPSRRVWDEIYSEEEDGEPINDAVFKRNTYVEDSYGITIQSSYDHIDTFAGNMKKLVRADEDAYEVIIPLAYSISTLYTSNIFYNLLDLEYVDFSQPWWDQNAVSEFTLADYLPFSVSDMIILDKRAAACIFFNKKVAVDYNVGDLYSHVSDNTWTMDTMIEIGKTVSEDLNGDSKFDDEDRYGLIADDTAVINFFHSAGCRFITKDSEGYPQNSFESEYNYTAIKYYLDNIMFDDMLTRNNSFVANAKSHEKMFAENQGLFIVGNLGGANTFRDMEADFGILPTPKYNASQENYAASVSIHGASVISVPITTRNLEMVGVILEAMAAESKYTVIPAFYETVLKDKATRDLESEAMMDIIINNMTYDVGAYYSIASFPDYFLRITGSAFNAGHSTYPQQTSDIASFYAKYEKILDKGVASLIKSIDKWVS